MYIYIYKKLRATLLKFYGKRETKVLQCSFNYLLFLFGTLLAIVVNWLLK